MGELKIIDSKVIDALKSEDNKQFIQKILDNRASTFITSMVSIVSASPDLQKCTPASIMGACLKAAALNLPIEPSLGFAYPVPFGGSATFMIGWKGYVQLAMRTGQYKKIIVTDVRVGEVVKINHFTETYEFEQIQDDTKRSKSPICGYYTMFELKNGFVKELYWPIEKLLAHGKKYSKSFNFGPWKTDQDAMCRKTMIKQLIPKYGVMSIEMEAAYSGDGSEIEYNQDTGEENIIFNGPTPENAVEAEIIEPEIDPAEKELQEGNE